jgi:hypothetical protein
MHKPPLDPRTAPAGDSLNAAVSEALEPRATLPKWTAHECRLKQWGPDPSGWTWYSVDEVVSPGGWWKADIGTDHGPSSADHHPVRWRPANEPSGEWRDAGLAVDEMECRGYRLRMQRHSDGVYAAFAGPGQLIESTPWHAEQAETEPLAIARAVVLTIRAATP